MKVSLESSVMLFTDYWESDCQHLQDFSFNKISSLLTAYQCESLLFLQFYQILSIHYVLEKYWHNIWSGTIFFSKTSRKKCCWEQCRLAVFSSIPNSSDLHGLRDEALRRPLHTTDHPIKDFSSSFTHKAAKTSVIPSKLSWKRGESFS